MEGITEAQAWNVLIYLVAFLALGYFIRKWINHLDTKLSEVCNDLKNGATKDELLTVSNSLKCKASKEELSKIELRMAKEIDDVWERVNHHKHTPSGGVEIPLSHP